MKVSYLQITTALVAMTTADAALRANRQLEEEHEVSFSYHM